MLETLKKDDLVLFNNGEEAVVTAVHKRVDGWYNVYFNKNVFGTRYTKDFWWIYDKDGRIQFRDTQNGVDIIKVVYA